MRPRYKGRLGAVATIEERRALQTSGVRWGDCGEAMMLAFRYTHPRACADVEIRRAVRVPRDFPLELTIGGRVQFVCWGVMPSGMRRYPVSARW